MEHLDRSTVVLDEDIRQVRTCRKWERIGLGRVGCSRLGELIWCGCTILGQAGNTREDSGSPVDRHMHDMLDGTPPGLSFSPASTEMGKEKDSNKGQRSTTQKGKEQKGGESEPRIRQEEE